MNEETRPATDADVGTLVEFYRTAAEEMTALKPVWAELDGRPEPVDQSFLADIHDDDALVLMGEIDGEPVGYLVARLQERLPQSHGRHVLLNDIYVLDDARAVGVGEELMGAALEWARQRGARSAEVRVLPGHRTAKNFCEQNGFTARLLLMHHNL